MYAVTNGGNALKFISNPPYFCEIAKNNKNYKPGFYIITKIKTETFINKKVISVTWYYIYELKKWIESDNVLLNLVIFPN